MAGARFPQNYENLPVRRALRALAAEPTMAGLDALLEAALTGGLTVDVTGSQPGHEPRVRTLLSSESKLVLPIFTSVRELRSAVARSGGAGQRVQALTLPARDALAIVSDQDLAAVQFNPGSDAVVVAREHIEKALA